ncbi:hypothetical protein [Paenibacillus humicus]|uniref:hypothetical protein n=1 Tax=Paenibacillus humicus TaxID=412861 RepID=UPI000FDC2901|nr:hypothetical protein [Paenibacillus humicus]
MKPQQQYKVIATDAGAMLIEGQTVKPYYEDDNEIILDIKGAAFSHHVRKSSPYFTNHFQPAGGQ